MDSIASLPLAPSLAGDDRFTLTLEADHVMLAVSPGADSPPAAADILSLLNDLPIDDLLAPAVFAAVREPPAGPMPVASLRPSPGGCQWVVKVSPSRLAAWAVPFPGDGDDTPPVLEETDLRRTLVAERVNSGLLEDVLARFAGGKLLDAPVCVARGVAARASHSARIEVLVDSSESRAPCVQEDGSVDFHEVVAHRSVQAGTVLARRQPPVTGVPGRDVYGRGIPVAPARDVPLSRAQGKGTTVEGDELVAAVAGRPVVSGDRIDILPVYEVKGDVDFGVGNINFPGDVVIRGDVQPGFTVHAGGSVNIAGIVDRASIIAGHDIAARGIVGDQNCNIEAGGDVVVHYLHHVTLRAGGSLRAQREIVNCRVQCARAEVPSTGRIVGGRISARRDILAGTLGSPQSATTILEVLGRWEGRRGVIRAARVVHPGVVISVGSATQHLEEELPGTSFWDAEGEILCLAPGSADPDDAAVARLVRA